MTIGMCSRAEIDENVRFFEEHALVSA